MKVFQKKIVPAVIIAVGLTLGVSLARAKAQSDSESKAPKALLYMLLPYESREQLAARTGANQKAYWGTWAAYGKKLAEAGVLAGGSALEAPSTACTLRSTKGTPRTTTGSYATTKEQISGYLLLKVTSMAEAQRWAAQCPAVQNGGVVEIRPTISVMASDQLAK